MAFAQNAWRVLTQLFVSFVSWYCSSTHHLDKRTNSPKCSCGWEDIKPSCIAWCLSCISLIHDGYDVVFFWSILLFLLPSHTRGWEWGCRWEAGGRNRRSYCVNGNCVIYMLMLFLCCTCNAHGFCHILWAGCSRIDIQLITAQSI